MYTGFTVRMLHLTALMGFYMTFCAHGVEKFENFRAEIDTIFHVLGVHFPIIITITSHHILSLVNNEICLITNLSSVLIISFVLLFFYFSNIINELQDMICI